MQLSQDLFYSSVNSSSYLFELVLTVKRTPLLLHLQHLDSMTSNPVISAGLTTSAFAKVALTNPWEEI